MNMQIKNNFITSDETLVIFNWCFIEFQSHPHEPNGALLLTYKVVKKFEKFTSHSSGYEVRDLRMRMHLRTCFQISYS